MDISHEQVYAKTPSSLPLSRWSKLVSLVFIPFTFVLASLFLEIALFAMLGWSFPPSYMFSFAIIVVVAAVIACIPSRVAQLVILLLILVFQAFLVIGIMIAYVNLGEIFLLEHFRAAREIIAGNDSADINPAVAIITVSVIVVTWLGGAIFVQRKYKPHRSGFRLKGIAISALVVIVAMGGMGINWAVLPATTDDLFANVTTNRRFVLNSFNSNRFLHLRSFGTPMFYTRNIFEVIGMGPALSSSGLYRNYEFNDDTTLPDFMINGMDMSHIQLNADYNVIMLMLETIEFDAINPWITPNLWRIKNQSTWVDGYHAIERTCMAEYSSLVGSQLAGIEMWSSFTNTNTQQSLPHIFRRAFVDEYERTDGEHEFQIGGFHNFNREFYRRNQMFRPNRLGFDWIMDNNTFINAMTPEERAELEPNARVQRLFELNSDRVMFDIMTETMAPADKRFFSYVLNVGTHTPHFMSAAVRPAGTRDSDGRLEFSAVPQFETALDYITYLDSLAPIGTSDATSLLEQLFPRLNQDDHVRRGVYAYLTAMHDFDIGIGMLLEHLETTVDFRYAHLPEGHPDRKYLIDTTAMILYTDHFNFGTYINYRRNRNRGGLLSNRTEADINPHYTRIGQNLLLGEQGVFIIYNPRDKELRDSVNNISSDRNTVDAHLMGYFNPENREIHANVGRRITRFASINEVYRSITHLFQVETYDRFTLGTSVFDEDAVAVGIGFITGFYWGFCIDPDAPTFGQPFRTRDFVNFRGAEPSPLSQEIFRERLTTSVATMLSLRTPYETRNRGRNSFVNTFNRLWEVNPMLYNIPRGI